MNFINNTIIQNTFKQKTLKKKIFFSGVGVHNGRAVSMSIEPADVNTGIVFRRIDIEYNNDIQALIKNIDISNLCTKIKNNFGVSVSTIEHLMASFNALGIDNAIVKLNAPELPALDGSSSDYTKKIIKSGIRTQNQNRQYLKILRKVEVLDGKRFISISPSNQLSINIRINYPNTIIGNSELLYLHSKENFINNIAEARTYALFEDVEKMRTTGLAMGGNLNNAIVVDKFKILNPNGLRFDNEFVRHKTLDCIGDFYLLGMPLVGAVECYAPGHSLNQNLVKEILKDEKNFKIDTMIPNDTSEKYYNIINNNVTSQQEINVA